MTFSLFVELTVLYLKNWHLLASETWSEQSFTCFSIVIASF